MKINGKVFNFLGDSITESVGASCYQKCFVALFANAHPDAVVNNYGLGGTRIAPQRVPSSIPQHDRDFIKRVDEMDERADLVCVFGGTNDYGHGDAPFGQFGDETLVCLTKK
ncbi:MAG: SGNH/GDSL hydrolase family protein [Clostridia bacterium]|nr:SGNH/GDSL hydrolase family protein [Clostridia bacterium]